MRFLPQSSVVAVLVWGLSAGCTTRDSVLDQEGSGGAQGGTSPAQGGSAGTKGGSAGTQGGSAGLSSSGSGGRATGGSAGMGNGSGAGSESAGGSGEGGDAGRAGTQGAGMNGGGSGGTEAGGGGGDAAGAAGAGSCPPGQMWCPGCTVDSGMCAEGCPGSACAPCSTIESLAECETRTDCHSVFVDPGGCDCPLVGCCAHFAKCADNDLADCSGANVKCEALTPYCESPAYVVSYSGICYEGCVKPEDCAASPPTPCPMIVPVDGSPCGGDTQCYYDSCPTAGLTGRAIATCSSRVWNVETGTSCTVECSGFGQQCEEGEICLVHAGGAVQIECIPNGCGTGPILAECAGNCPVFFSLEGGATATCNTCPQGGCP
jgi:hypothetical protein